MNWLVKTIAAAFFSAGFLCAAALADSWPEPAEEDYYAANDAYYLHVVPGEGVKPAGATLYRAGAAGASGDALVMWSRALENAVAPADVLVAASGAYVVTFDDWGRAGYGENVVVIYGPGGELVRKFALEDLLTDDEIALVPHSTSSRWWRGEPELDEDAGVVVLKIIAGGMTAEMKARTRDLRVALASGEVLH